MLFWFCVCWLGLDCCWLLWLISLVWLVGVLYLLNLIVCNRFWLNGCVRKLVLNWLVFMFVCMGWVRKKCFFVCVVSWCWDCWFRYWLFMVMICCVCGWLVIFWMMLKLGGELVVWWFLLMLVMRYSGRCCWFGYCIICVLIFLKWYVLLFGFVFYWFLLNFFGNLNWSCFEWGVVNEWWCGVVLVCCM